MHYELKKLPGRAILYCFTFENGRTDFVTNLNPHLCPQTTYTSFEAIFNKISRSKFID